jgi:hypothetical protein
MEDQDRTLILQLKRDNFLLGKLYSEHLDFEQQLSKLENRPFLVAAEEEQARRLKRKKLFGVDRMMQILRQHKDDSSGQQARV